MIDAGYSYSIYATGLTNVFIDPTATGEMYSIYGGFAISSPKPLHLSNVHG
jgi:hypothetical protein